MTALAPRTFSFRSSFARMGQLPHFTEAQIAAERALRFAPIPWAREHGGPIVRAFLTALPEQILASETMVVRAKPSFLREGWSGGGVGWHLDSVWGHEDWSNRHRGFFRACAQLGGIAATRIVEGVAEFPLYQPTEMSSPSWHEHVEEQLAAGRLSQTTSREGQIFMLNAESIHSVSAAEHDGWRIFLDVNDASLWTNGIRPLTESYDEVSNGYYARSSEERLALAAYGGSYV